MHLEIGTMVCLVNNEDLIGMVVSIVRTAGNRTRVKVVMGDHKSVDCDLSQIQIIPRISFEVKSSVLTNH